MDNQLKKNCLHIPMSVFNLWNVLRLCLFMRPWKYLFDSNSWYKWTFVPRGQFFFTSNHMQTGWGGDRCVKLCMYIPPDTIYFQKYYVLWSSKPSFPIEFVFQMNVKVSLNECVFRHRIILYKNCLLLLSTITVCTACFCLRR